MRLTASQGNVTRSEAVVKGGQEEIKWPKTGSLLVLYRFAAGYPPKKLLPWTSLVMSLALMTRIALISRANPTR